MHHLALEAKQIESGVGYLANNIKFIFTKKVSSLPSPRFDIDSIYVKKKLPFLIYIFHAMYTYCTYMELSRLAFGSAIFASWHKGNSIVYIIIRHFGADVHLSIFFLVVEVSMLMLFVIFFSALVISLAYR